MKATQAWEKHHKEGKTDAITGRWFGTKPMEELYDTAADPDNVNNLINDPSYKEIVARMSSALDKWQVKNYDSALLPESEMVKRAADNKTTIYEMVRNPALYDLKSYQKASALALKNDPEVLPELIQNLKAADGGVRYWGIVGCFNLYGKTKIDLEAIRPSLKDNSHEVRALAAWIFYKAGQKDIAKSTWKDLLKNHSYASLKVTNIIDWIGDGTADYEEAIRACNFSHEGYVNRMKEYFGYAKGGKK